MPAGLPVRSTGASARRVPRAATAGSWPASRAASVAVRNSRDPHGPALVYTPAEIAPFLTGTKARGVRRPRRLICHLPRSNDYPSRATAHRLRPAAGYAAAELAGVPVEQPTPVALRAEGDIMRRWGTLPGRRTADRWTRVAATARRSCVSSSAPSCAVCARRTGSPARPPGDAIRASHAKISRLELGRVGFKERDVADLLDLYGVDRRRPSATAFLTGPRGEHPGWWHRYSDVLPGWFEIVRPAGAGGVDDPQLPGAVRARPVPDRGVRAGRHHPRTPGASDDEVERRVAPAHGPPEAADASRDAPTFWAVLDEAALRRPIGGRAR